MRGYFRLQHQRRHSGLAAPARGRPDTRADGEPEREPDCEPDAEREPKRKPEFESYCKSEREPGRKPEPDALTHGSASARRRATAACACGRNSSYVAYSAAVGA